MICPIFNFINNKSKQRLMVLTTKYKKNTSTLFLRILRAGAMEFTLVVVVRNFSENRNLG